MKYYQGDSILNEHHASNVKHDDTNGNDIIETRTGQPYQSKLSLVHMYNKIIANYALTFAF